MTPSDAPTRDQMMPSDPRNLFARSVEHTSYLRQVDVRRRGWTAFRAIKKEDPAGEHVGRHDISCLRTLFLAGERADPDTIRWAEQRLKVPVIDHWWQTETGAPMTQNPVGLGFLLKYGSPGVPMPGYDMSSL